MNRALFVVLVVALVQWSESAYAQDEAASYDLWFDAQLTPHPDNPPLDGLVDGDRLTVHVDPTRIFPSPGIEAYQVAVPPEAVPRELKAFYVIGPVSGASSPVMMQPGVCPTIRAAEVAKASLEQATAARAQAQADFDKATKASDAPATTAARARLTELDTKIPTLEASRAAEDAKLVAFRKNRDGEDVPLAPDAIICSTNLDEWPLESSDERAYVCGRAGGGQLGELVSTPDKADWSLVKKVAGGKVKCLESWHFVKGPVITGVSSSLRVGANAPDSVVFAKENGRWSSTFVLKRDTKLIRMAVTYDGDRSEDRGVQTRVFELQVSGRDTHSLVRIQGELLVTNRMRVVSLAVALTPVSRAFFTDGPGFDCILLCALTPSVLLRLSGEQQTLVQLGGGLGLNLSRAFQLNSGVLVGTNDGGTAWRFERNWFVGFAVDPLILSEAWSTGAPAAQKK